MNKQEQINAFNFLYEGLNEQQKNAVNQIEGPVMVIAGPGTGKTQILSARIGRILLETDVSPESILCLTYTDAGAIAMRKRLVSFIGTSAYKINIATFHAFCNDIIQDNLSLFNKASLDPISELERIELLKQLIDGFEKDNPLKRYRGDIYFEMENLSKLYSTIKKEGWNSSFLIEKVNEYIDEIPFREEFTYKKKYKQFEAGSLKQNLVDNEIEKMSKLKAAIKSFDVYQQLMRERNRYDFEDMINWVIKAFKENKNLLAQYQERFLYILVDEFQDTSGTQNELLQLLVNYWDQPNLFVVGDDDQSIFRFQGANVENMLHFQNQYQKDILTIVLEKNYRSTQPILDAASIVISNNNERLVNKINGLEKKLISANPVNQINPVNPEVFSYDSPEDEMIETTEQIIKLIENGTEPNQIAVLYKEHKYGEELAHYLQQKNIPIFAKRTANLLDEVIIKQLISILAYLDCELDQPYEGDQLLFEILHYKWWGIAPITIAKITFEANQLKYQQPENSFRKILVEKTQQIQGVMFQEGGRYELGKAIKTLESLIQDVPNFTLLNLIEKILQKTGLIQYVLNSENKGYQLDVITQFFDFIKEETHRKPSLNLNELVTMLGLMKKEGIRIQLQLTSGGIHGVNLLTCHGSKGLEFENVFLVGTNAHFWEKKRSSNITGYSFPDTIFNSLEKADTIEELRRLFYVAVTRAKKQLQISFATNRSDGKVAEPSQFITEFVEGNENYIREKSIDDAIKMEYKILRIQNPTITKIEQLEADFINPKLSTFTMNVTALNNYLKCPLHFYFNSLIRVPSGKSEATTFGSAIHDALNKLFKKMQDRDGVFPSAEELIHDFNIFLYRHREAFTQVEFNRRKEHGEIVLNEYYNNYISTWNKVVATEYRINNVIMEGIPLKGAIDKIEFDGKKAVVVDYKTGSVENAKEKLLPPNEKNQNGGDYWRQAVFYKILLTNHPKQWEVVSAAFDFIEPNKKKQFEKSTISITDADIEIVKKQIREVWEKVQNKDFYTGCGKAECHWCNFIKNNDLNVALHQINNEGLEESD